MKKNILAITACLKRCSVAFWYEENLYEANEYIDAAANLVCITQQVAATHNINFQKIDGIITASGPGSFTGIRVAQSFAKGLALSLRLPSASVSYFDVIHKIYAPQNEEASNIVILIESEKGHAYYKIGDELGVSTCELLKNKIPAGATLIGDACEDFPQIIPAVDFRKAKHLLHFSDLITDTSKIVPLYK
ncbi:MAG: tRNA (adenosine(37)-N6)-threonylcarbamoyltransferase complex dimerization subunit type 1 TsaB [Holosporaceae bacterium]|nr:tRNA (adenosine(37)-N6)-threonylcarbamoyltransferase complex dimerization subunit type 1 TsaB [Holosporaceae bacterium]